MNWFFKRKKKKNIEYVVDEGTEAVWHYHYKIKGEFVSLCGKPLLGKDLSLGLWGYSSDHVGETYCKECEELMNKIIEG